MMSTSGRADSIWAPLRIGIFRALWLAVLVSNIGSWMQTVGAQWLLVSQPHASILVALVQLGQIATIEPGIGAVSFAAVVIITMIAAMSFDPRLMWDAAGENGADHD